MPFDSKFYKMWDVPKMDNKIDALRLYIERHHYVGEDAWDYIVTPEVAGHLNLFSAIECYAFIQEMEHLEEDLLFRLADIFLFEVDNQYFDVYFLYCKIFMTISNLEHKEYLLDNIHNANCIVKGSQPLAFYKALRKEVFAMSKKLHRDYAYTLEKIDEKIAEASD